MTLISQIKNIKNKISGKISFDENLSKLSWFNLGGPAKILFRTKKFTRIIYLFKRNKRNE